jgi:hypothetical protein
MVSRQIPNYNIYNAGTNGGGQPSIPINPSQLAPQYNMPYNIALASNQNHTQPLQHQLQQSTQQSHQQQQQQSSQQTNSQHNTSHGNVNHSHNHKAANTNEYVTCLLHSTMPGGVSQQQQQQQQSAQQQSQQQAVSQQQSMAPNGAGTNSNHKIPNNDYISCLVPPGPHSLAAAAATVAHPHYRFQYSSEFCFFKNPPIKFQ